MHGPGGGAGIHQIVHDQESRAVPGRGGGLQDADFALDLLLIRNHGHALDQAAIQFPRHDCGRDQAAARYRDDAAERP